MRPMQPSSRMRYSIESRCKMVGLILGGWGRRRPRPPAAPAELPGIGCGGATARAGGQRWVIAARRRVASRGGWIPEAEREILAVRRRTNAGPLVISAISGRPASTVGKVLRRWGCSRLPRPERDPIIRYERARPGELVHVDTKKLGRFHVVGKRILRDGVNRSRRAGWQHLHIAIDDYTRLAYAEVLAGQDKHACAGFLRRAVAWYATRHPRRAGLLRQRQGLQESHPWRVACAQHRIRRRYTRPYTPRTNGKAEALIKTMLREWAYRYPYPSSHHRSRTLSGWIRWYNNHRPHGSLSGQPPISRVSHVRGQYN